MTISNCLRGSLLAIVAAGAAAMTSGAAAPATRPATNPAAADDAPAANVVQARVVINGQQIQIQGNGQVEVQVVDGEVMVGVGNAQGNVVMQPRLNQIVVAQRNSSSPGKGDEAKPAPVPAKLTGFTDLVSRCAAFREQTYTLQWKTVYEEEFADKQKPTWRIVALDSVDGAIIPPGDIASKLKLSKIKDRTVLNFDAEGCHGGTLAVGPKVRGNYAIEMVAANHSATPSDLSLFIGQVGQWIGLQFGGQRNTMTALWATRQNFGNGVQRILPTVIPNGPQVESGRFYTIRVEVVDDVVKGFIDKKLIAERKLNTPDETGVEQQPNIYTWASKISVDRVKTEMQVPVRNINADKVWDRVFTGQTKEQVDKQIETLVGLLADEDAAVRDGATEMLKEIGPLAVPAVKSALDSGIPEQASRAKQVMDSIPPG